MDDALPLFVANLFQLPCPFSSGFDRTTIPRQVAPVSSNPRISSRLFPSHFAKFSPYVLSRHFVYLNQSIARGVRPCSLFANVASSANSNLPEKILASCCRTPSRDALVFFVPLCESSPFFLLCLLAVTVESPFALFTCLVLCSMYLEAMHILGKLHTLLFFFHLYRIGS